MPRGPIGKKTSNENVRLVTVDGRRYGTIEHVEYQGWRPRPSPFAFDDFFDNDYRKVPRDLWDHIQPCWGTMSEAYQDLVSYVYTMREELRGCGHA